MEHQQAEHNAVREQAGRPGRRRNDACKHCATTVTRTQSTERVPLDEGCPLQRVGRRPDGKQAHGASTASRSPRPKSHESLAVGEMAGPFPHHQLGGRLGESTRQGGAGMGSAGPLVSTAIWAAVTVRGLMTYHQIKTTTLPATSHS